jgi:hypothetical protein
MNSKFFIRLGLIYFILSIGTATCTCFFCELIYKDRYFFTGTVDGTRGVKHSIHNLDLLSIGNSSTEGIVQGMILFAALFFVFANVCLYWGTKLKNADK